MFINHWNFFIQTFLGIAFMTVSTIASAAEKAASSVIPIEHWQLKNGVNAYLISMHEIPIVDIGLVFFAGSSLDGEHSGLATFTNAMLDEGTKTRTADQIAQEFENVGAEYRAGVELDYAALTLRSMSDKAYLEPAVSVFTDVINNPSFPSADFKRIKQQILIALQEQEQEPQVIAEKAFFSAAFNGGPYSKPSLGNKESVTQLTEEHVTKFYQQYYTGSNVNIVLVGDLDRKSAEKLAEKIVGNLPKGSATKIAAQSEQAMTAEMKNIRFPSEQTHILIGQRAIPRSSPDYFSLLVGNHILGGGVLTSRLYKSVREENGLAYSVYSYFEALKMPGPFLIGMQTRNQEANKAIKITRDILSSYLNSGPSEEELKDAKNNLINGFALRLASNRLILDNVMNITAFGLPLNYLDTYRTNVAGVSIDSVKSAFQRHVHPKSLVTITVGNAVF
jgi:zinc protease